MRFLPRTELKVITEPSRLTFEVERESAWLEWVIGAAGICLCFWEAQHLRSLVWLSFGLIALFSTFANWTKDRKTVLVVTSGELTARGNVGRLFSSERTILASEVDSMEYRSGGAEEGPSGLFVKHGWRTTCLIESLSEEQTKQILDQIYRHFPEIGKGDSDPGSLFFGRRSDVTRLNLR